MKSERNVSKEIEDLEKELLNSQSRKSVKFLNDILADEFIEFGSSGKVYNKKQIIDSLQNEITPEMVLSDFELKQLSDELFLATYKVLKKEIEKNISSLRSSIWKLDNSKWQMIFHQGTTVKD